MKLDFSQIAFKADAFSKRPMTFIDTGPKQALSSLIDLIAIETGERTAREDWQKAQLRNLLKHAYQRSAFWRKRLDTQNLSDIQLSDLPILMRSEVSYQVKSEGPLLSLRDGLIPKPHSTSGSTGRPVHFFVSTMNVQYNVLRSIAQYFIEGFDLSKNRTVLRRDKSITSTNSQKESGLRVKIMDSWLGPLSDLIKSGHNKVILYRKPDFDAFFEELSRHDVGYLAAPAAFLNMALMNKDIEFLRNRRIEMLLPRGAQLSTNLRTKLSAMKLAIRSNYSSEEVGLIGSECTSVPDSYHVAHSNVVIEADKHSKVIHDGKELTRILITHLHSYATPLIRYDIGDFAIVSDQCKCGFQGTVLSDVYGRSKNFVIHSDGRLTFFVVQSEEILKIIELQEFRIRQVAPDVLLFDAARCRGSEIQRAALKQLLQSRAGGKFRIEIRDVDEIDWGDSQKQLGFVSEIL